MAERLGLVGKARPHLCHLQHRGFGLSVGGVAGDFQAPRRKPTILLGAPHLPTSNSLARVQRSRMPERSGLPPGEAACTSECWGGSRAGTAKKFSSKAGSDR